MDRPRPLRSSGSRRNHVGPPPAGHFATSAQKVRSAELMGRQNRTIRDHGLGEFAVLANAMVVDPAMLIWLDGQKNTAKAANENLGRELMELFTLGVGHYSEEDVRAAAKALTGWKVNRDTGAVTFNAKQHDNSVKTVLGTTGPLDAHGLVDVLVKNPASPRFIAQRLWSRTVSNTPPPDDVLARLVKAGTIRDLVKAIVADNPLYIRDREHWEKTSIAAESAAFAS
ncbi:DUF1800 family protein [Kibdelosporangium lantanae]|uniref:DUF1800 family protein n=1 Tax=Kibdelosporangium lantanae TaxID=1497396 RepID=A0ABW3M4Y7_9PSEU